MNASSFDAVAARSRFWRSISEAENGSASVERPPGHGLAVDRRRFMKAMGASLALAGAAGCARTPLETIVPYRDGPAQRSYGEAVFYASTLTRDGYGIGILAECNMGRPTKIEGNPSHPASLGATDVFAQAAVLELWDPDRSQSVRERGAIRSWGRFLVQLERRSERTLPTPDLTTVAS